MVTDFNWFTREVLEKLFRPSEQKEWGNTAVKSDVLDYAMTSDQIEGANAMKHLFGGNAAVLPKLLERAASCVQALPAGGLSRAVLVSCLPTGCAEHPS